MSTALTFDNIGDQILFAQDSEGNEINTWQTNSTDEWSIEGSFLYKRGSFVFVGEGDGSQSNSYISNYLRCSNDGGLEAKVKIASTEITPAMVGQGDGTGFIEDELITFKLYKDNNAVYLVFNPVTGNFEEETGQAIRFDVNGISTTKPLINNDFSFIGFNVKYAYNDGLEYTGQLRGIWTFSGGGQPTRTYNLDTQDTSAGNVTLVDQTSGFNLTSTNMPTDGSAWVEYTIPDPEPEPEPTDGKWALEFDGINDYLSMSSILINALVGFSVSGKFIFKPNVVLLSSTVRPDCFLWTTSTSIVLYTQGLSFFSIGPFEEGELIDLKIERPISSNPLINMVGNEKEASIDAGTSSFEFNRIGRPSPSTSKGYYNGQLSGEWLFNVIGEPDRIYDFNLSGNSKTGSGQPVVIDTISGENAVGVNMSTEDSNWVELQPDQSGVNLIQYNGQDILDVKYSDSNSVLQNVEMNLGSVPVWGGTPAPEQEWGLQFDGNNDYVTYPTLEIEPSQDFSIKLTAEFKADTMLLGNDSDILSYIYCTSIGGGKVTAKIEDGSVNSSQVSSEGGIQDGQVIEIELKRLNNTLYIYVDGVLGNSAPNGNASNFNTIGSWGNSASQPLFYSGMFKGKLEFLLGPGFNTTFYVARSYDFNLSGNSKTGSGQPVLIDTISGENAVGVNMNTDDSNWVELTPAPEQEWGLYFNTGEDLAIPEWTAGSFEIRVSFRFPENSSGILTDSAGSYISAFVREGESNVIAVSIDDNDRRELPVNYSTGDIVHLVVRTSGTSLFISTQDVSEVGFSNVGGLLRLTKATPNDSMLLGTMSFDGRDNLASPDRSYDFNLSGNSKTGSGQPIVIDTISGENAVGVNMNTDDSNWVELIAP